MWRFHRWSRELVTTDTKGRYIHFIKMQRNTIFAKISTVLLICYVLYVLHVWKGQFYLLSVPVDFLPVRYYDFPVAGLYIVGWYGDRWVLNWKGFGWKRSWPSLSIIPALPRGNVESTNDPNQGRPALHLTNLEVYSSFTPVKMNLFEDIRNLKLLW
jgi:hypothetical protein